jgi:hypothetical protein
MLHFLWTGYVYGCVAFCTLYILAVILFGIYAYIRLAFWGE